ncbi:hypothetical protein [Paenibacillus paeoniae]|uniref:Butirosin biosynthesis protein H N-terminal domain-containing protein n=1 Tax=Paenibacillus paeoniae TaxID=2292705 RepID=A0A371PN93_9BACL|nr:hypothetical protein [Paenibacillus paeoniae]REK77603.1 hypothetical protein DX130_11595 [Paenibacillus paeoniae]
MSNDAARTENREFDGVQRLPFTIPDVYGFLGHAYVLGILQNYEECKPWIYTHYNQLYISKDYMETGEYRLDFFPNLMVLFGNVPWLQYRQTNKDTLANLEIDIHRFLQLHLDEGYYCSTYVDEYYIPNSISNGVHHFSHDLMVFGYDRNRQIYNIAIFDKNRQFSFQEVTFENFSLAYYNDTGQKGISLCRKVEPREYGGSRFGAQLGRYDLELQTLLDSMSDYLHSVNTSKRLRFHYESIKGYYGLEIYTGLQEYFRLLAEGSLNLDVRPLHILWEHKKMMTARIRYLQEQGALGEDSVALEGYTRLEGEAMVLRNMLLKYFYSRNNQTLRDIANRLEPMQAAEKQVLTALVEELGRRNHLVPYQFEEAVELEV